MKENIPSLPCHFVSEQGQVFRKDEYIDGRFPHNSTPGKIGQDSPTSKYSNRLKLRVFRYKRRHPEILLRELSTKFKMPISVISKIIKGIDPVTKTYL